MVVRVLPHHDGYASRRDSERDGRGRGRGRVVSWFGTCRDPPARTLGSRWQVPSSLPLCFSLTPQTAAGILDAIARVLYSLIYALQNEYIEEHIKRHGRRLDYYERKYVSP